MPLNDSDLGLVFYVASMVIALIVSYAIGAKMIARTGLFVTQTVTVCAINFLLDVGAIGGWSLYSWKINEFMFFGGFMLGVAMLGISEVSLIAVLLVNRKKLMQRFTANANS